MTEQSQRIEALFTRAGIAWALRGEHDDADATYLERITDLQTEYSRRFGRDVEMLAEMERDTGLSPLVQSLAMPLTTEMRTMVYCVLRGGHIESLTYRFETESRSELDVVVKFADGESHAFASSEHWDALVLHQLGIAKVGDSPIIDGYHGFRTS